MVTSARVDLILSGRGFGWVPQPLCWEFTNTILEAYFSYPDGELPDIQDLTETIRDLMLATVSYEDTGGKSTTYWSEFLEGLEDEEQHQVRRLSLTDGYYLAALGDVNQLLKILRLTYCDSENVHNVVHFAKEVW